MTNTESIRAKLTNLHAVRAGKLAEIETLKARGAEINEAMMSNVEYDGEEFLQLSVKLTAASKQGEAVDVAIKAASEALTASQWGDRLTAARDHVAARPDTDGDVRKLAASMHKKVAAIEAKAVAWNDASRVINASAKGSPLRELTKKDLWGAAIIDGDALTDINVHNVNALIGMSLDVLDREEREAREAALVAEAGPNPYTTRQLLDAKSAGVDVATYVENQRLEAVAAQRWQDDVWASMPKSGGSYSGSTDRMFPTTGR